MRAQRSVRAEHGSSGCCGVQAAHLPQHPRLVLKLLAVLGPSSRIQRRGYLGSLLKVIMARDPGLNQQMQSSKTLVHLYDCI
jgi:hypothetical protein